MSTTAEQQAKSSAASSTSGGQEMQYWITSRRGPVEIAFGEVVVGRIRKGGDLDRTATAGDPILHLLTTGRRRSRTALR